MSPEFRTILYATDLSPRSAEAFRYALSLARRYEAKIHVLHAVEPLGSFAKSMVELYLPKEQSDALHQAGREKVLGELRRRLEALGAAEGAADPGAADRVASVRVVEGRPGEAILAEAGRLGADLIVMGSHGHSTVGEILLGTTAHRVMQRSPVPVLLVRAGLHPA